MLALGLVSSAGATPPGSNGRIVFQSSRNGSGNSELYSVNSDGSAERRLTWTSVAEQGPVWSPDGTRIAYVSVASESGLSGSRIWVMNADGSAQTQLTTSLSPATIQDIQPQWSPDGTQIAFASTRNAETWSVWVINADGNGLRRVTNFLSNDPAWSPDGRQLAYVGANAIGVVDADGANAHVVSGPGGWAGAPSWSPDGGRLAFYRNDARGYPGELYLVNTDGSNETQLTTGGFNNAHPSWSPDGTQIVFQRSLRAPEPWHLWRIGTDGLNQQQLTTTEDYGPDWGTSQVVPETSPPDAPVIEILSPQDGGVYHPLARPVVIYECSSFVSYVVSCEGDAPVGQELDLSASGTHTFTVRAVDIDGRAATKTVTYEVLDVEPPQIDLRVPTDGATYELDADVRADYSCSDPGGSGIAQCQGNLPNGAALDTDNAGQHVFSVAAYDKAGHLSLARAVYTVVDRRPPRIEIGSPFPGLTYPVNTAATASYYCWSPGGVWIVSCTGTVPSGDYIPSAAVGPRTFTVTAQDANGKTTTRDVPYVVVYSFQGYEAPVDADGFISGARAGDGIALKFSLSGDQGLNIVSKTLWQPASCTDWTATGSATSADAKLSYSASTDRYRDVVATSSAWKGTCRILRLTFADSISRDVRVRFK